MATTPEERRKHYEAQRREMEARPFTGQSTDKSPDELDSQRAIAYSHTPPIDTDDEEKAFCPKCRPLFRGFLKRWFEKYPAK